jgi:phenylacetate-coenzyme A ligase PaaK-like adenylate-forming protein
VGLRNLTGIVFDLRRNRHRSDLELASLRQERLARLIGFAREKSPYYRKLYERLPAGVTDLRMLPPVAKSDLMENFDAWVTDPAVKRRDVEAFVSDPARIGSLFRGRFVAFATSGTSGRPAVFLHDGDAARVYAALAAMRRLPSLLAPRTLRSLLFQGGRTAMVVTTGGHFTSSVIEGLFRGRYPILARRSRAFSILAPLTELTRDLNDYRPAILGGYPTAITLLAQEQAEGRLKIHPGVVLTGAERLSPNAREQISATFRCPVRDTYAASEFMGIAFDCRHGRLHVNADWLILEPVDAAYRPVPPGRPSHTCLLTNLVNRIQPILRYELGDSVTFVPTPCPCGNALPVIDVAGRSDEILCFRGPGGETLRVLPMAIATLVEETPGVRNYQAIQREPSSLILRIEEVPGIERRIVADAVAGRLRGYLEAQGFPWITVEATDEMPRRDPAGGKLRQVYSEIIP